MEFQGPMEIIKSRNNMHGISLRGNAAPIRRKACGTQHLSAGRSMTSHGLALWASGREGLRVRAPVLVQALLLRIECIEFLQIQIGSYGTCRTSKADLTVDLTSLRDELPIFDSERPIHRTSLSCICTLRICMPGKRQITKSK